MNYGYSLNAKRVETNTLMGYELEKRDHHHKFLPRYYYIKQKNKRTQSRRDKENFRFSNWSKTLRTKPSW